MYLLNILFKRLVYRKTIIKNGTWLALIYYQHGKKDDLLDSYITRSIVGAKQKKEICTMTKKNAIRELKANINLNFSHAVLLYNGRSWRTELHAGHAGNCCCNDHDDFVWRETTPYTDIDDMMREIER